MGLLSQLGESNLLFRVDLVYLSQAGVARRDRGGATDRLSVAETLAEPPLEPRDLRCGHLAFKAVWKAAQLYLRGCERIDLASPKGLVQACAAEARWGMGKV